MSGFLDNLQKSETKVGTKSPKKIKEVNKEIEEKLEQSPEPKNTIELDRFATYIVVDGELKKL